MVEELSELDRQNIAALVKDPKYISLLKLEDGLKAKWLQQVFHKRLEPNEELIKRGGVMILQIKQQSIQDQLSNNYSNIHEAESMKSVLDGFGW